jgi:hypothetical protein
MASRRGGYLHVRFEVSICMQSVGGFVACDQRFIGLKWRRQGNRESAGDAGNRMRFNAVGVVARGANAFP